MKIAIIDYGAGNIQSVRFALKRLGYEAILSKDPMVLQEADKVIFPGVGSANAAMEQLRQSELDAVIPQLKQPVLGICLGMQLLCSFSEEGETQGLGIFDTNVVHFPTTVKAPQMGWNTIQGLSSPLFKEVANSSYVYAVHSYYVPQNRYSIATTTYGMDYAAAMAKDNFYGVQFHPEKSGPLGAKILSNFIDL